MSIEQQTFEEWLTLIRPDYHARDRRDVRDPVDLTQRYPKHETIATETARKYREEQVMLAVSGDFESAMLCLDRRWVMLSDLPYEISERARETLSALHGDVEGHEVQDEKEHANLTAILTVDGTLHGYIDSEGFYYPPTRDI